MNVLWPSKYAKIRFRPGLCLLGGSSRRFPRPLVGWGGTTPPMHISPHAAPINLWRSPCLPQNSSRIYAYAYPYI